MKLKGLMASILSLAMLFGFTGKLSYADFGKDMEKIVQQVYEQTSTNYPPNNMSYEMQKIVKLYTNLSKSDKEKFQKIYRKSRLGEIKNSVKRFFGNLFGTLFEYAIGFGILALACFVGYHSAPMCE